jgi:hypothetical protein
MEGVSMRPLLIVAAPIVVVWALAAAVPVQAQPDDHKAGKAACQGADGKAAPCPHKTAKAPSKARVSTPMISRCRDVISHQAAKCGGPNAEPVPAN